jgi:hypothetical protein
MATTSNGRQIREFRIPDPPETRHRTKECRAYQRLVGRLHGPLRLLASCMGMVR